ncbi:PTS sugar transporter subunit IIA [Bacillus daqingensis]|uniref:Ascorbate-specific PTS system EIIA component n=1 Tax=Bacillus daqingensis TaxID=872396 RepID=A0ABV9NUR0_9BACI
MLRAYLQETTALRERVHSWEDSIKIAAHALLEQGYIKESYVEKMISNVHEFGPYIVIVPGIALPHAQNEGEVNKNGISMLKLEEPVLYPEDKEVQIVMVLAATDSSGHLDLISELASMFADDDIKQALEAAQSKEEILSIVENVE